MKYKKTILDNGVTIVSAHMPGMQSLSLGFWVKAGGRYETKKNAGISHFLEHLLFEGTKNRSSKQIKEAIEGIGGSLNGFTAEEVTCYLVKVLNKHLDLSLDVLSDMILNAALSENSVEKERLVITEEINMYMDLPGHLVLDLLNKLIWPNHPLGMFLTGTPETVNAISRKDIVGYKNKFYTPGNIVIVIAGSFEHKTAVEKCRRYFSKIPKGKPVSFGKVLEAQKTARFNLRDKPTEQTHIAIGVPALSINDPDRFAASVLHIILGANMSSRLFQEIREKRGLAYEISTNIKKYKDTGSFFVCGGIKNSKFVEAVKVILKELKRIKSKPPDDNEVKRAKEFYAGQMLMALEDTYEHMLWAGEQAVLLDRVLTAGEILKKVNNITKEDIMRIAEKLFKCEKLNLAAIGPINENDRKSIGRVLESL